ncbi:aminodeoxychorismate lyase [Paenibacillus abyssi]|uniref:4-amino-4-deoxychorismate lyase n=1 Tax=Paenibacillus abyssi TaxID=1340531 RepID=A0A917G6D7_9BACL|nr:aminodeoxychorismate lyase [Paenibacillus abyssi]GGG24895.1 4-amino-4-deoxychorismate lyase [Paenibacillus abyssi]
MKVGFNGSVIEAREAVISVYDHGFLYGMGLFETFRTYNGGKPYLLDRHLKRLEEGCLTLGIQYIPQEEQIKRLLRELLQANRLEEAYVRLTVSAGEGELGLPTADYERPNILVLVKPLPTVNELLYVQGKELRLLSTLRNSPEGEFRQKSLHYMNNILAKRELTASGASAGAEGLMRTREGWLAEGIVSNLFFVRDGILYTPDISTGILPGITRRRVMELAEAAGLSVQEGYFTWEELLEAAEVWVTNSIQEIVPVTRLSDEYGEMNMIGKGEAGPITKQLLQAYRADANAM